LIKGGMKIDRIYGDWDKSPFTVDYKRDEDHRQKDISIFLVIKTSNRKIRGFLFICEGVISRVSFSLLHRSPDFQACRSRYLLPYLKYRSGQHHRHLAQF